MQRRSPLQTIAATLATAANPAVTGAFALAIVADGAGPACAGLGRAAPDAAAARHHAQAIEQASGQLRRVAHAPGSYVSESNFFNERWQEAFRGGNYPRLRAVKASYDPEGLFFVHHGVGSEQWSDDGFTRAQAS